MHALDRLRDRLNNMYLVITGNFPRRV